MKNLLIKELKLAASPLSYCFILFAAMTMIPGYPILVGAFFVCLGIFYTFQQSREANDILYTILLPIDKKDVVRARYAFVCLIELAAFALMAVLTVLRMTILSGSQVYRENVLMTANPVYLGFAAVIFALFNGVFVGGYFRTAYRFGKPFILFVVLGFVVVGLGETLHHLPGLSALNDTGFTPVQAVFLALGLAVFVAVTLLSCRRAERRFEKLDL